MLLRLLFLKPVESIINYDVAGVFFPIGVTTIFMIGIVFREEPVIGAVGWFIFIFSMVDLSAIYSLVLLISGIRDSFEK